MQTCIGRNPSKMVAQPSNDPRHCRTCVGRSHTGRDLGIFSCLLCLSSPALHWEGRKIWKGKARWVPASLLCTPPQNQARWYRRRPGEAARPTSPGLAESRRAARHRADPAAAPGSGGQTWQRPGSATTTCGRPPPGRAAPPPHAPGNPPAPGSLACKPAGVQPEPLTSRHVISTGCPAGEGGFGTDEMEAGTPGRSPRRAAGDERPRPYLDGKAE